MAHQPSDRFDNVPDDLLRTGAHRAALRKGHGWIAFAWAALFTGILVAGGLTGLAVIRGNIELPFLSSAGPSSATPTPTSTPTSTPTPTPTPTDTPKINPALPITVLNGTRTNGLATQAGEYLVSKGWSGAANRVGSRANAATRTLTATVVYFGLEANRAAAEAMVLTLKVGSISLSSAYPESPITVVLGSDFVVPVG